VAAIFRFRVGTMPRVRRDMRLANRSRQSLNLKLAVSGELLGASGESRRAELATANFAFIYGIPTHSHYGRFLDRE
jgi:hypothetical protein